MNQFIVKMKAYSVFHSVKTEFLKRRMPSSGMWRRVHIVSAATCSRWFLARGFLYPEDGGDTFLRNVSLHGATSQKTAFFIVTAVNTSNLA
jgi:hypothetical protein